MRPPTCMQYDLSFGSICCMAWLCQRTYRAVDGTWSPCRATSQYSSSKTGCLHVATGGSATVLEGVLQSLICLQELVNAREASVCQRSAAT